MKKVVCIIFAFMIMLVSILTLCGCGNQRGYYDLHDVEYEYAVIYETKQYFAHELESYAILEDAGVIILQTKCCEKTIMTHMSRVILYSEMVFESSVANIQWCNGAGLHS